MKYLFTFTFLLASVLYSTAQPPAGPAKAGNTYGQKINAAGALSLQELTGKLKKQNKYIGKIRGTVLSSCAKKGCWMEMQLPDETTMMVKFKDYAFFVPADIVGKTVVLSGEAEQKTITVEELKHYAKDAKKPQAEVDAITQPEKQVSFVATGVLVE